MTVDYEPLAIKYAPRLYYKESDSAFRDISPDDLGGFYWRTVDTTVSWADICIQYIGYFKQQRWDFSILDKYLKRQIGSHPNDFVPIFLYLKNEKPVKIVFDIWHYDLVGEINDPTPFLHEEGQPQFLVFNYYRGLNPLKKIKGYKILKTDPEVLDQDLLKEWYLGRTCDGDYIEEAKFVIKNKLDSPFQVITTFRDKSDLKGTLIEAVILAFILKGWPDNYKVKEQRSGEGLSSIALEALKLHMRRGAPYNRKPGKEEVEKLAEFIQENVLIDKEMLDYLVLPEGLHRRLLVQWIHKFIEWLCRLK
jgi:hypothetical protein